MPSSPPDIGNTQNDVQQETFEENGMEELMTNVRRKRPCPSKSKRDVRNGKFDENLERLVNVLEQESEHGTTMEECIAILKQMPKQMPLFKIDVMGLFSLLCFSKPWDSFASLESDMIIVLGELGVCSCLSCVSLHPTFIFNEHVSNEHVFVSIWLLQYQL